MATHAWETRRRIEHVYGYVVGRRLVLSGTWLWSQVRARLPLLYMNAASDTEHALRLNDGNKYAGFCVRQTSR